MIKIMGVLMEFFIKKEKLVGMMMMMKYLAHLMTSNINIIAIAIKIVLMVLMA